MQETNIGIRFNVYNIKDDSKDDPPDRERLTANERKRQAIARELTRNGILARSEPGQNRIWCFYQAEGDIRKVEEQGCTFVRDGVIDAKLVSDVVRVTPPPAAPLHVFRLFAGAVDAVISATLSKICKPVRLKPMVWLVRLNDLSPNSLSNETGLKDYTSLLVQVCLRIATNGSFVYLTEVTPSNLRFCDECTIATPSDARTGIEEGVIAPIGTPVQFVEPPSQSFVPTKGSDTTDQRDLGAKANAQAEAMLRQKERVWKSLARERLRSMNLGEVSLDSLEDTAAWTWVELDKNALPPNAQADRRQRFLWPTSLCFADVAVLNQDHSSVPTGTAAGILNFHDAIVAAEEWFNGAESRLKNCDAAEEEEQVADDSAADGLEEFEVDTLINSPVYSRGIETTNGGGVYPTPPDGVMPGAAPEVAQVQTAVTSEPQEDPMTLEQSPTALSQGSSFAMDDEVVDDGSGDLFGEAEDAFDGPGITDDDFSFFDDSGAGTGVSQRQFADDSGRTSHTDGMNNKAKAEEKNIPDTNQLHVSVNEETKRETQADEIQQPSGGAEESRQAAGAVPSKLQATSSVNSHIMAPITDDPNIIGNPSGDTIVSRVATPPLSPFAIKERLLPLPIPASTIKSDPADQGSLSRRGNSNFGPVNFNLDFSSASSKYGALGKYGGGSNASNVSQQSPTLQRTGNLNTAGRRNISLPEKLRIKTNLLGVKRKSAVIEQDEASSEEESEYESGSDDEISATAYSPPKKWKPGPPTISIPTLADVAEETEHIELPKDEESLSSLESFVQYLLYGHATLVACKNSLASGSISSVVTTATLSKQNISNAHDQAGEFWNLFQFDGGDLIAVSQIVAEQSFLISSAESDDACSVPALIEEDRAIGSATLIQSRPHDIVDGRLTDSKDCGFPSIASMSASMGAAFSTSQPDSSAKLQPRPVPRRGLSVGSGTSYGHYIYPITAPLVRVNRSGEAWDMLYTALEYWDVLGLEPCNASKDIHAYAVLAGNAELAESGKQFLQDLEVVYEACKLGSFTLGTQAVPRSGLTSIAYCQPSERSTRSTIAAIRSACMQLAEQLIKGEKNGQTVVVYLLNPFREDGMIKYICACFWEFCKSYSRTQNALRPSNIVLQVVPMEAVAIRDCFVVPNTKYLKHLAHSTYDMSPLPQKDECNAVWQIDCTPSVRVVPGITRKINFMLSETPPSSLMQEAQVLHLSYAISSDGDWLSAAWTDYTGQHQHTASFCLARAEYHSVLSTVRNWTASMMPDKSTWRLIVARLGSFNPRERIIWTEIVAPHVALTMLDLSLHSPVYTIPTTETPLDPTASTITQPQPTCTGSSFLTPVSTPQATPQTVSPDAHGHTAPLNAPTPDATDPSATDPDAQLLDSRDETWALILPFSVTHAPDPYVPKRVLASGVLLRRGEVRVNKPLPSLGIDIIENLAPKTAVGQTSWLMPRSAEGVLREVLGWYRGLALMARLRGVKGAKDGILPWHVGIAVAGARGLDGFLDG